MLIDIVHLSKFQKNGLIGNILWKLECWLRSLVLINLFFIAAHFLLTLCNTFLHFIVLFGDFIRLFSRQIFCLKFIRTTLLLSEKPENCSKNVRPPPYHRKLLPPRKSFSQNSLSMRCRYWMSICRWTWSASRRYPEALWKNLNSLQVSLIFREQRKAVQCIWNVCLLIVLKFVCYIFVTLCFYISTFLLRTCVTWVRFSLFLFLSWFSTLSPYFPNSERSNLIENQKR